MGLMCMLAWYALVHVNAVCLFCTWIFQSLAVAIYRSILLYPESSYSGVVVVGVGVG